MNILEIFPRNILTVEMLEPGQPYSTSIDHVEKRDGPGGPRAVLVLSKPVLGCRFVYLNRTSALKIASEYGEETDGWTGRGVIVVRKRFYGGREGILIVPANQNQNERRIK